MSKIQRLAPQKCPDCHAENSLYIDHDRRLTCRLCNFKQPADDTPKSIVSPDDDSVRRDQLQITFGMPNSSNIDRWAEVKYQSGLAAARQKRWDEAIKSFEQAIEQERDFVDAHLWLARISLDPIVKRNHYGEVIALMPMNLEATRELMVLNGDMTRAEADRADDMSRELVVHNAQQPVAVRTQDLSCSNCGGKLQAQGDQSTVTCQSCGHQEVLRDQHAINMNSFSMAMIQDKGKAIKWRVGEYLLHCEHCGAERIIIHKKMTTRCPFCASDQVLKADALQSFRQPDGIVPFSVNREEANTALHAALNSVSEKLKGLFVNNKAEQVTLNAVYIPFWVFDIIAQITRTRIDNTSKRTLTQARKATRREQFTGALDNLPFCAVTTLEPKLTKRLTDFDFSTVTAYKPTLLANRNAQLYNIDYTQASLDVRPRVAEIFRFINGHDQHGDVQTLVSSLIQQMSFRLLLLPLWVATIIEQDGDVRIAVIHGQTAKTLLGKAQRSS